MERVKEIAARLNPHAVHKRLARMVEDAEERFPRTLGRAMHHVRSGLVARALICSWYFILPLARLWMQYAEHEYEEEHWKNYKAYYRMLAAQTGKAVPRKFRGDGPEPVVPFIWHGLIDSDGYVGVVMDFVMLVCSPLIVADRGFMFAAPLLLCAATFDFVHFNYLLSDGFRHLPEINEFHFKRLVMITLVGALIWMHDDIKKNIALSAKTAAGLLGSAVPLASDTLSRRASLALLGVRVLFGGFFAFSVWHSFDIRLSAGGGPGDTVTQIDARGQKHTTVLPLWEGHLYVWPKIVEMIGGSFYLLGMYTSLSCGLIGATCFLEAALIWQWWWLPDTVPPARVYHFICHWAINVGIVGGMFLLQRLGGGLYSVDEVMKKRT